MGNLRYVKAVLWAFVGLGRRKDMSELRGSGNPLIMVVVAFVLLAMFHSRRALQEIIWVDGQAAPRDEMKNRFTRHICPRLQCCQPDGLARVKAIDYRLSLF